MEFAGIFVAILVAVITVYFFFFAQSEEAPAASKAANPAVPPAAAPAPAAAAPSAAALAAADAAAEEEAAEAAAEAAAAARKAATAAAIAEAKAAMAEAAAAAGGGGSAAAEAPTAAAAFQDAPEAAPSTPKKPVAELPNLLVTRPNKPGEAPTQLLLTHRAGQVDFKFQVVRQLEDGSWEYYDTMQDPETTGSFKLGVDGSTLEVFAQAPRKWFMRFVKEADESWRCTSPDYPGTTAVASTMTPAPSKLGAGGLPKGSVNLGEVDEDAFNPLGF